MNNVNNVNNVNNNVNNVESNVNSIFDTTGKINNEVLLDWAATIEAQGKDVERYIKLIKSTAVKAPEYVESEEMAERYFDFVCAFSALSARGLSKPQERHMVVHSRSTR